MITTSSITAAQLIKLLEAMPPRAEARLEVNGLNYALGQVCFTEDHVIRGSYEAAVPTVVLSAAEKEL